ncbi:hypothetical protein [Mucilaginibacter psychrotolerans]|uniref:Uncharacterized protein n=1 Tax=Mucilaginibacter psychrotolerans TaxID=1524096 RepID=A0A4Y8SC14_9SPHI|nr:hypothetical protein [Mucilaginibacter psychrotolerans]TFF36165.1 hypothetical protein E2R66_16615 [Mucilaginibacter psychrotolerans]
MDQDDNGTSYQHIITRTNNPFNDHTVREYLAVASQEKAEGYKDAIREMVRKIENTMFEFDHERFCYNGHSTHITYRKLTELHDNSIKILAILADLEIVESKTLNNLIPLQQK